MAEMMFSFAKIMLGLAGLVIGGELLVRGASKLAATARISPLIIGITVVSFGTSTPELAVTVQAAHAGSPELAVGNVVGSNIANILLILGAAALVTPLAVESRIVKVDVPMIFAASLGLWLLSLDGGLSHWDGALLFSVLVIYLIWSVRQGQGEADEIKQEFTGAVKSNGAGGAAHGTAGARPAGQLVKQGLFVLGGLILLVIAARAMVTGASEIARAFGVSELVIGLTVVAVGTSLPELVASVVASLRGQGDIAVGNVVGSNLFNILAVLGIGAMVAPDDIPVSPDAVRLDIPIMIAAAIACLPLFFTGCRISRTEGAVLLGYFVSYTAYVTMGATDAAYTRSFEIAMIGFVIPLTLLAVAFSVYQSIQSRRRQASRKTES
jgi:cation:H+ antiporter